MGSPPVVIFCSNEIIAYIGDAEGEFTLFCSAEAEVAGRVGGSPVIGSP